MEPAGVRGRCEDLLFFSRTPDEADFSPFVSPVAGHS